MVDIQNIDILCFQLLAQMVPGLFSGGIDLVYLLQDGFDLTGSIQTGFIVELVWFDDALVVQRADAHHEKFIQIGKVDG